MTYKRSDNEFKAKIANRADELRLWEETQARDAKSRHARNRAERAAIETASKTTIGRAIRYIMAGFSLFAASIVTENLACILVAVILGTMISALGFVSKA